jgi:hypothetical protein
MITGITIKNFRGFREAELDGLARVNIVVGDNGSGKTALLEAIFLATTSRLESAMDVRRFRSLPIPRRPNSAELASGQLFSDLPGFAEHEASVHLRGEAGGPLRRLRIFRDPMLPSPAPARNDAPIDTALPPAPLVFEWSDAQGHAARARIVETETGPTLRPAAIPPLVVRWFSTAPIPWSDATPTFSELEKAGEVEPFLAAMREQFPGLTGWSVQIEAGEPMLHARFEGEVRLRPISLLSAGLTRIASLLLAISRRDYAAVLIDEIENGLHHARFSVFWKQVRDFAIRYDTQVFATTHSLECLDAAADEMSEHPDDFAFIRATRSEGTCLLGMLPGVEAGHLLRSGLEVRG